MFFFFRSMYGYRGMDRVKLDKLLWNGGGKG